MFRIVERLPGVPMAHTKPKRSGRSGRFEASSPLDDAGFLGAARGYVRGVDRLVPLLQFMADRVDPASVESHRIKMVQVMLDGMASRMAGQLVERGERLMFGRPPSVDLIAAAFGEARGDGDDHDALSLCVEWCGAIDAVLWYLEAVGVTGSKRSQKLLGDVSRDADPEGVMIFVVLDLMRDALGGLRKRMVDRLSAAEDRYYLGETKKPVVRLPTPLHRLMSAGALGHSK